MPSTSLIRLYKNGPDALARKIEQHLRLDGYKVEVTDLTLDTTASEQISLMTQESSGVYVMLPSGKILSDPTLGALWNALLLE